MAIRVILADDQQLFRAGLRSMIEKDPGIDVVGEAGGGREALRLAREVVPDVIVMDVSMPDLNGIDATHEIKAVLPKVGVIGLSAHSGRHFVRRMLDAGASGYLLKDCAFEELARAIRAVADHLVYLSPAIAAGVIETSVGAAGGAQAGPSAELSHRQREVLQLIAEGLPTKQIAARLHISVKTVETHRVQIMKRLNIQSVAELTKYAIREGLTSVD